MKRIPVVGETLYRVGTDRRFADPNPLAITVERVGTKYFYLQGCSYKFDIKTWRHAYDNPFYVLYESIEEFQLVQERAKLETKLRLEFHGVVGRLSFDQLRRINAILEEKSND